MGYYDGLESAEGGDFVDGGLVEEGDQIEEDVAGWCLQKFGSVADGEFGFGADGPDVGVVFVLPPDVSVVAAEFEEGGEGLACCWDVLSWILSCLDSYY